MGNIIELWVEIIDNKHRHRNEFRSKRFSSIPQTTEKYSVIIDDRTD